jgi:aspartate racemase
MTRIGLIGGMSWESSAEYYRLLNELTRERDGGLASAECILYSVNFAEIEAMQTSGRWAEAGERLAAAALSLEAAGAELLLLCTNTMHKVAGAIEAATTVPLLHLGDATAEAVRRAGLDTVGLLGTAFTMEQDFYRSRLESHGLTVLVPEPRDRALVHRVIYDELCLGMVRSQSRDAYVDVVDRLAERGAQGVVLGCTEIELLLHPADTDLPLFATTRLHVEAALERASAPLPTGP